MFKSKDLTELSEEFVKLSCELGKKQYLIYCYEKEVKEMAHKMEKLSRTVHHAAQKENKIKLNIVESANETL